MLISLSSMRIWKHTVFSMENEKGHEQNEAEIACRHCSEDETARDRSSHATLTTVANRACIVHRARR